MLKHFLCTILILSLLFVCPCFAQDAGPLPGSYDLRSQLPALDHQKFENCWAYAATDAAASTLIKKNICTSSADMSVWDLTYFAYIPQNETLPAFTAPQDKAKEEYYNKCGNDWQAVALMARGTGMHFTSQLRNPVKKQQVYKPQLPLISRDIRLDNALYLGDLGSMENAPLKGDRINLVKRAIIDHGGVTVTLFMPDDCAKYFNTKTNSYYCHRYSEQDHSHSIVLAGWDDNYSRKNFVTDPGGDGAWLVRDSAGDNWSGMGYYYISYRLPSLAGGVAYDCSIAYANERIYQYDPLGCTYYLEMDTDKIFFANMFTAEGNDTVYAAAFYVPLANADYTVSVCRGCTKGPNSGTLAAVKKLRLAEPGYHTVKFDRGVTLARGERFSVLVEADSSIAGPPASQRIPCETPVKGYAENVSANTGEGWWSFDGQNFRDITVNPDNDAEWRERLSHTSICLKALATEGAPVLMPNPYAPR